MSLEYLINPIKAERNPWESFFLGLLYSSLAIIISLFIFRQHSSILVVSLTTMACIPLIYGAIKLEEKKDLEIDEERILIKEHGKALMVFIFLFFGFLAAFIIWFVALPTNTSSALFDSQLSTINEINSPVTGNAINTYATLGIILLNNIKVLAFCLLFALFYGFGAIYILTWNASVLAVMIGTIIRNSASSYMSVAPLALIKYTLHGIPEIAAYFLGGLAGGIISIAVIRHDFKSRKFRHVIMDSIDLIILSIGILVVSALIEVFISPLILQI